MDNLEKTPKSVSVPKNQNVSLVNEKPFVKLSDLTKEDFMTLPKRRIKLKKTVSKNGYTKCFLETIVDPILMTVSIEISEDRFNFLRLELGKEITDRMGREVLEYDFKAPFRFVKGKTTDGNEYMQLEIILGQYLYHNYFFADKDKRNVLDILESKRGLKIDWFDRPEAVDITETVNWQSAE